MAKPFKLMCNIDRGLIEQVDNYAASLHITRTAAISVLLSQALQAQRTLTSFDEFIQAYKAEQAKAEQAKKLEVGEGGNAAY